MEQWGNKGVHRGPGPAGQGREKCEVREDGRREGEGGCVQKPQEAGGKEAGEGAGTEDQPVGACVLWVSPQGQEDPGASTHSF